MIECSVCSKVFVSDIERSALILFIHDSISVYFCNDCVKELYNFLIDKKAEYEYMKDALSEE